MQIIIRDMKKIGEFLKEKRKEKELTTAGETFLNAGGIQIDKDKHHVVLSRIFKWYVGNFGKTQADRLRYIAHYAYNREDREYILKNAENLNLDYQDYDWRLNRY